MYSVSYRSCDDPRFVPRFGEVNYALEEFVAELKAQGIFDNVVIVTHSDFARTLTPNSNAGTDHGWSGIQMVPKLRRRGVFCVSFSSIVGPTIPGKC